MKVQDSVHVVHIISHHSAWDNSFTVECCTCNRFGFLLLLWLMAFILSTFSHCNVDAVRVQAAATGSQTDGIPLMCFRPLIATLLNCEVLCVAVHNCLNCVWSPKLHGNAGQEVIYRMRFFDKNNNNKNNNRLSRLSNNPAHLLVE